MTHHCVDFYSHVRCPVCREVRTTEMRLALGGGRLPGRRDAVQLFQGASSPTCAFDDEAFDDDEFNWGDAAVWKASHPKALVS